MVPLEVPKRRNGLTPPYSGPQIASWLFLAATIIHFALFITTILPFEISVAVTAAFFVTVFFVFLFGMRAIAIDPIDDHLRKKILEERDGVIKSEGRILDFIYRMYNGDATAMQNAEVPEEETKHCWISDTQVAEHSMHCKYCGKSVANFDHHCMWLNTSIGSKNYKDFFRLMLAIAMMQIIHFGVSAYLVVDIFLHGPSEDRADDWLGVSGPTSIIVSAVLLFFMFFDFVSLILLAQLIVFHIKLQQKGITTYQFIVQDSQRRREKAKLELELEHMRMTEVTRAQEQGHKMEANRLIMGGKCRNFGCAAFDPLDMPQPPPEPDRNAGFSGALGGGNNNNGETPEQPEEAGNGVQNGQNGSVGSDNYHDEHDNNGANSAAPYQNGGSSSNGGVGFIPVNGAVGGMSNERHDLDSQATQSELGDPDDIGAMTPTKNPPAGGLLGANPRDRDDEEEDVLPGAGP